MPRRALVAAAALCVLASIVPVSPSAAAGPPPTHVPPVDAPVVDPFRPPPGPYQAGNRGLEYDTAPGTEVAATAPGVVVFAGFVAGSRHVTVLHADGVRTSYSYLARIDVVAHQHVAQGQVLGTTEGRLHLGARVGDAYFDPATLFSGAAITVHLVPFDEPPGTGRSGERSAIGQLIGGLGGLARSGVGRALSGAGSAVDWLRSEGPHLLRTAGHYLGTAAPGAPLRLALTGLRLWGRARSAVDRECTAPSVRPSPPPAGGRMALLVGGLGSTSDDAAIDDLDVGALGYDPGDVVRFSYAGGRTPDPGDRLTAVEAAPYTAADTQVDLHRSGARLADLVEDVAREAPGTQIDLLAHSQGGLVARLAVDELERRHGAEWLERLGLVATLGTPHGGADLATAAHAIGSTAAGSVTLDGVAQVAGLALDDDAPAAAQLSETSDLVRSLRSTPLPDAVASVSVAARGDVVVPVPRTVLPGSPQVVVPLTGITAHDDLPGSPDATREVALALAGQPPTCTTLGTALLDQATGEAISWAEDAAGSLGWLGALSAGAPGGG